MLWVLVASALAQQGSAAPQGAGRPPAAAIVHEVSEAAFVDSLEAAELRFFHDWNVVWRASEQGRHPFGPGEAFSRPRDAHLHCHPDEKVRLRPGSLIASQFGWYAVCPTWLLGSVETQDERYTIDAGLRTDYRQAVDATRRDLASVFVAAAAKFPRNDWIVGQAVRLLVDARNLDAATSAAQACAATRWWCEALKGYVLNAGHETVAAENVFRAAVEHMPRDVRCRWTDFRGVLDSLARVAYAKVPCEQRDSVNQWLWWLADPLYSVPGNPRLAEQYSRQTLVALHSALDRDERYDWRPGAGGDALAQMIMRYGWPSYTYWGGEVNERGHNAYLAPHATAFNETYTTFEYSAGRTHLIPTSGALKDPLHAAATDWTIADSAESESPDHLHRPAASIMFASLVPDTVWWPREHAAFPLIQLPEPQIAVLRRQTHVLVASAVDLDTALVQRAAGESLSGTLLLTDRPDSVDVVARGSARAGGTLVLHGTAAPRPALLGVELAADSVRGLVAARTRFSVSPPATLATMSSGEVAVSEPVVLRAGSGDAELPADADSALALMAGSTHIAKGEKIGVYWESYGFQPTDSVTLAVWIERYTPQGFIRQLGITFKVATDLNTPVATTWDEVSLSRGARLIAGPVPIIGRSVVVDVSKLPRGDYWLEIAVGKRGQTPVRARRTVTIR